MHIRRPCKLTLLILRKCQILPSEYYTNLFAQDLHSKFARQALSWYTKSSCPFQTLKHIMNICSAKCPLTDQVNVRVL